MVMLHRVAMNDVALTIYNTSNCDIITEKIFDKIENSSNKYPPIPFSLYIHSTRIVTEPTTTTTTTTTTTATVFWNRVECFPKVLF